MPTCRHPVRVDACPDCATRHAAERAAARARLAAIAAATTWSPR